MFAERCAIHCRNREIYFRACYRLVTMPVPVVVWPVLSDTNDAGFANVVARRQQKNTIRWYR